MFIPQYLYSQSEGHFKDSIELYIEISPEKVVEFSIKLRVLYQGNKNLEGYIHTYLDIVYSYYFNGDLEKCNQYILETIDKCNEYKLANNHTIYAIIWYYKGMIDYEKENYLSAIKYFEKAIDIDKNSPDISSDDLAAGYNNLASVYDELGDYKQAISFYNKTLSLDNRQIEDLISLYNNINLCFYKQKDYKQASFYIKKALKLTNSYETDEKYLSLATKTYINAAINYQSTKEYPKTLFYLNKVLNLKSLDDIDKARVYKHLGTTYYELKDYSKALENIQKSLVIREELYPKKHSVLSITHQSIAEIYIAQKEYAKALNTYQKAIKRVVYDFDNDNPNTNPTLENVVHQVELLKSLSGKANTQLLMKDYQNALNTYTLCSELMDKMRTSFQNNASKLFLVEQSIPIYEKAIEAAIQAGKEKVAFQLAEKSKGMLLLEATRGIEARFGLSDKLLAEEQNLKVDITFYERKIWEERQGDTPNAIMIQKWENIIFDLKEKYTQFKKELASSYPDYYQLQYDTKVASVETVQKKLLNKRRALVSYFIGNESIYIFTITKSNIQTKRIPKTIQINEYIKQYRQFLELNQTLKIPHLTYYKTASKLYDLLLKDGLKEVPNTVNQLVIIPSDQLNYIPFEALLTEKPDFTTPRYEFNQMPYLIKKYQITYGYSATLLLESKPVSNQALKNFGGFVPEFGQNVSAKRGCDEATLGNLPYGKKNITAINEIMNGVLHFDTAATLQNFKSVAQDYKILHLCTHACASSDFKDTRIYFTDEALLAFELYNLPLQARLAVLSACETGVGELKRGEGVMSLARAFMYAGCPSVITSLWSVDDASTSELMLHFYKNLKDGKKQDEALHLAKLQYLENKGIQASHPYYWSAFIHVGDTAILFSKPNYNIYWIGLLMIVIIVSFFVIQKYQK